MFEMIGFGILIYAIWWLAVSFPMWMISAGFFGVAMLASPYMRNSRDNDIQAVLGIPSVAAILGALIAIVKMIWFQ